MYFNGNVCINDIKGRTLRVSVELIQKSQILGVYARNPVQPVNITNQIPKAELVNLLTIRNFPAEGYTIRVLDSLTVCQFRMAYLQSAAAMASFTQVRETE